MKIAIENFAQQVHLWARGKGWWEKERTQGSLLMLMVTELAEATEEVRRGKPAVYFKNVMGAAVEVKAIDEEAINLAARGTKPEGEAVELVDCAVRIADWFGHKRLSLMSTVGEVLTDYTPEIDVENPLDFHLELVEGICAASMPKFTATELAIVVTRIMRYFEAKGWDFWGIVNLKMAFNEKRPYRHGGKLA